MQREPLVEYINSASLVAVETRLLKAAASDFVRNFGGEVARRPAVRLMEDSLLGSVINQGTQLLYTYGTARLALRLIQSCRKSALTNHPDNPELAALCAQWSINSLRLARALGLDSEAGTYVSDIQSDVEAALAAGLPTPTSTKIQAAAAQVVWLEAFKIHWRRGEYARCEELASSPPRPNLLADECLVRSFLEQGRLDCVSSRITSGSLVGAWTIPYIAITLSRAGQVLQYRHVVEHTDWSHYPSIVPLRLCVEAASLGLDDVASNLALQGTRSALDCGDHGGFLLSVGLLLRFSGAHRDASPPGELHEVLRTDRHNVVRILFLRSLKQGAADAAAEALSDVVDSDLLAAYCHHPIAEAVGSSRSCQWQYSTPTPRQIAEEAATDAEAVLRVCELASSKI